MSFKSSSYWLALGLMILVIVWLSSGSVSQARDSAPDPLKKSPETVLPNVAYRALEAETIADTLSVEGYIEARHNAWIRSRLDSSVEEIPVREGQQVRKGDTLLRLDRESLPTQIAATEARLRQKRSELKAAESLSGRRLASETDLATRQADLAETEAELSSLKLQLSFTTLSAPFDAMIETLDVEPGEQVSPGDPMIHLVSNHQLVLVAQVPQQHIRRVRKGLPVEARLLDGRKMVGEIDFIATVADTATRTYRVEALFRNADGERLAGSTAKLDIRFGEVQVHALSPAFLTLDDSGSLSIQHIDEENRVIETPVERVRASATQVWVRGLPAQIRLLTLGKGFVQVGETVNAQPEAIPEA